MNVDRWVEDALTCAGIGPDMTWRKDLWIIIIYYGTISLVYKLFSLKNIRYIQKNYCEDKHFLLVFVL